MINLDQMIEQRHEATGVENGRVGFQFKGKEYSFRDPLLLTDEEKEELEALEFDIDFAEFFMGKEMWEEFSKVGGTSNLFMLAYSDYASRVSEYNEGKSPRTFNRSQRRAAGSKR